MRNFIFTVLIGLFGFGLVESTTTASEPKEPTWEEMLEEQRLREEAEELRIKQYHEDELLRFLNDIGHRESGNRYDITNTWGYMGRYQFGKSTLKGLGFDVTREEFLNNPQLQEDAMLALLNHNKKKNIHIPRVFENS